MAISMTPETTEYGAYFPPGFEHLFVAMGLDKRWHNFSFDELKCKGTGALRVHYETLDNLQKLRYALRQPIPVNSYYRHPDYNATLPGASPNSQHMLGRAVDTPIFNGNIAGRAKLVHVATLCGFRGFGFYASFNHIDTHTTRFWDQTGDALVNWPEPIQEWEFYPR